jgi:hypothetical protein
MFLSLKGCKITNPAELDLKSKQMHKRSKLKNKISNFTLHQKQKEMALAQKKNQLAQKLLQTEDKHILKAIELLFSQEEESFDLIPAQKRELDKRLAEVESGKAKFYSIGEVKKIVRKNSKSK